MQNNNNNKFSSSSHSLLVTIHIANTSLYNLSQIYFTVFTIVLEGCYTLNTIHSNYPFNLEIP